MIPKSNYLNRGGTRRLFSPSGGTSGGSVASVSGGAVYHAWLIH